MHFPVRDVLQRAPVQAGELCCCADHHSDLLQVCPADSAPLLLVLHPQPDSARAAHRMIAGANAEVVAVLCADVALLRLRSGRRGRLRERRLIVRCAHLSPLRQLLGLALPAFASRPAAGVSTTAAALPPLPARPPPGVVHRVPTALWWLGEPIGDLQLSTRDDRPSCERESDQTNHAMGQTLKRHRHARTMIRMIHVNRDLIRLRSQISGPSGSSCGE